MTRLLALLLRRLLVLALGAFSVWLIVFVVFKFTDNRLPWIVALAVTYGVAAYIILPRTVRMSLKILQRKRVPSYTTTGDGFPGDPVNLLLTGTLHELRAGFAASGWSEADPLSLASSWRMVRAFVMKSPYPAAPFSTLYLFGRGQDIGFQKPIDDSPRKRHHVRFWALSCDRDDSALSTAGFWLNADRPPEDDRVYWVGAATKDTGISLTRLTFQFTHATDSDTNAERDFIMGELSRCGVVAAVNSLKAREQLPAGRVNHYITDGEVVAATLALTAPMHSALPS